VNLPTRTAPAGYVKRTFHNGPVRPGAGTGEAAGLDGERQNAGAPPALAGRRRELAVLRSCLAGALAGSGALALVSGEAGVGKTALVEAAIQADGRTGRFDLCRELPGVPPGPGRRPLVVVLEDLHLAGRGLLAGLSAAAVRAGDLPLLLVGTYRTDEVAPELAELLPALVHGARARRLHLRPLEPAGVRELVRQHRAVAPEDEPRLVEHLHRRAGGNPLLALELLHGLEADGVLRESGSGSWELGSLDGVAPPAVVRRMVERRVGRLGDDAVLLLPAAAVLGREVWLAHWQAVTEAAADVIGAVAERATAAQVLVENGDGPELSFASELVREVLYRGVPLSRRRAWHLRAAEAQERMPAPRPDLVAHHLRLARDPRALPWLVRAAEAAQRDHAWDDARARYRGALDMVEHAAPGSEERTRLLVRLGWAERHVDPAAALRVLDDGVRLAGTGLDRPPALAARYARGLAAAAAGRTPTALDDLRAVVGALARREDADGRWRDATACLGPDASEVPAPAAALAVVLAATGAHTEAGALADQVARGAPPPRARADAELARAEVAAARGQPGTAARGYREAARLSLDAGDWPGAAATALLALGHAGLPYAADRPGLADRLAARAEAALARAEPAAGPAWARFGRLPLLVLAGAWEEAAELARAGTARGSIFAELGWLALAAIAAGRGEAAQAWAVIHEALPDGADTEPGDAPARLGARALCLGAELALDAQDSVTALEWIQAHDRWVQASGLVPGLADGHLLWARHHRAVGEADLALRHARQACARAAQPRQPLALLAAHRVLGELETAAGAVDRALRHLGHALDLADACGAAHEGALTRVALAEAHAAGGQARAARAQLVEVEAAGAALGARPLLARARCLGRAPEPHGALSNLTAREVQVLRMIADGRSNADAAHRLGISRRTVEHHLEAVYGKLGVTSRTAAVREAVAHGLA
jgi:DNA-binding CsgD family transcriptional regulator